MKSYEESQNIINYLAQEPFLYMEFLRIFADVVYYDYQKYMMEVQFYPYWKISFCIGILVFCTATLLLTYILADSEKADSKVATIADFY